MNIVVTKQTHEKKAKELKELSQRIDLTRKDMSEAREQGDLSENFGYMEARKTLEQLSASYEEKKMEFFLSEIVDPTDWENLDMEGMPRAMLGAMVTFEKGGKQITSLIGGAGDNIPGVIPYNSPLGKALIPKAEGATTTLEINGNSEKIKILKCEVPKREKIQEIYSKDTQTKEKSSPSTKTKSLNGPEWEL